MLLAGKCRKNAMSAVGFVLKSSNQTSWWFLGGEFSVVLSRYLRIFIEMPAKRKKNVHNMLVTVSRKLGEEKTFFRRVKMDRIFCEVKNV